MKMTIQEAEFTLRFNQWKGEHADTTQISPLLLEALCRHWFRRGIEFTVTRIQHTEVRDVNDILDELRTYQYVPAPDSDDRIPILDSRNPQCIAGFHDYGPSPHEGFKKCKRDGCNHEARDVESQAIDPKQI